MEWQRHHSALKATKIFGNCCEEISGSRSNGEQSRQAMLDEVGRTRPQSRTESQQVSGYWIVQLRRPSSTKIPTGTAHTGIHVNIQTANGVLRGKEQSTVSLKVPTMNLISIRAIHAPSMKENLQSVNQLVSSSGPVFFTNKGFYALRQRLFQILDLRHKILTCTQGVHSIKAKVSAGPQTPYLACSGKSPQISRLTAPQNRTLSHNRPQSPTPVLVCSH